MINKWKANPLVLLAQLFNAFCRADKNQFLLKISF
jgi:hypothetical protein